MVQGDNYKAMAAMSVEIVLMRRGGPEYQLVLARLEGSYDCKIFDCYDHPDYLRDVLIGVYGKDYPEIVKGIEAEFGESSQDARIARFLAVLKNSK